MDDLAATRGLLYRQLDEAIATDALGTLPFIVELKRGTDDRLREAVRSATAGASWSEIAAELGVSKQAAHQRFKHFAKGVQTEIKAEHRAMKQAQRRGDAAEAAEARARRDGLVDQLKSAAKDLKTEPCARNPIAVRASSCDSMTRSTSP